MSVESEQVSRNHLDLSLGYNVGLKAHNSFIQGSGFNKRSKAGQ
jgi:hypothetical protein